VHDVNGAEQNGADGLASLDGLIIISLQWDLDPSAAANLLTNGVDRSEDGIPGA
jgi:hypothetical protein